MLRLRRAFGLLAGIEAEGLSAHVAARAQIPKRSVAAVPLCVKAGGRPRSWPPIIAWNALGVSESRDRAAGRGLVDLLFLMRQIPGANADDKCQEKAAALANFRHSVTAKRSDPA